MRYRDQRIRSDHAEFIRYEFSVCEIAEISMVRLVDFMSYEFMMISMNSAPPPFEMFADVEEALPVSHPGA